MLFTELVFQGVRNFSQSHRFPLGNGFTVFVGAAGAGKSTFVDALLHMLYPDTSELATTKFKSTSPDACRAALTIDDGKGNTHRLVKDFLLGSAVLTRLDPATGQHVTVSAQAAEILQYLSSTLHLPQQDVFEGVYVTRLDDLPSVRPAPSGSAGADMGDMLGVGAPPGAVGGVGGSSGLQPSNHMDYGDGFSGQGEGQFDDQGEVLPDDPAEIREQITVLERDIASASMIDDLQFDMDGLQSKMFELEDKVRGVTKLESHVEDLRGQLSKYSMLSDLPGDFESRVRDFEASKDRYRRDITRLDDDKSRWEKKAADNVPGPLGKNRNFMLGIGGGMAALFAGVAGFFVYEPLRWIALADLFFFAVAVVAAMRHIDLTMSAERGQKRLELIEERRLQIERKFDLESSMVRRTMQQTGADTPGAILELFAKHREALEEINKYEGELTRKKAEVGADAIEGQRQELQTKISDIESQLGSLSGMMMSTTDMDRKLQLLRSKLEWLEGGQKSAGSGLGAEMGVGAPPGAVGGGGLGGGGLGGGGLGGGGFGQQNDESPQPEPAAGPCQSLVKLAEDLFLVDADKINESMSARLSQFTAALTANTYSQVSIDTRGMVTVTEAASGMAKTVAELPPAMQDLVYLAMKFTFIESSSQRMAVPVFLDDPFKNIPVNQHEIICRMLAAVGRNTQVILLTSQAGLAQHATASYSL